MGWGLGFRDKGLRFSNKGVGIRDWGLGFSDEASGRSSDYSIGVDGSSTLGIGSVRLLLMRPELHPSQAIAPDLAL